MARCKQRLNGLRGFAQIIASRLLRKKIWQAVSVKRNAPPGATDFSVVQRAIPFLELLDSLNFLLNRKFFTPEHTLMNRQTYFFILAIVTFNFPNIVSAESTGGVWTGQSSNLAFGSLDGVSLSATSSGGAEFAGIVPNAHFTGRNWQGGLLVPEETDSLVAVPVNAGTTHSFEFATPIEEAMLLIENFDSSSVARISAGGDAFIELISASESISFSSLADGIGVLQTSNPTFNGEGDAVILFSGEVTGLTLEYSAGDGANGVFYGFAKGTAQAVPEPATSMLGRFAVALIPLAYRRRRK